MEKFPLYDKGLSDTKKLGFAVAVFKNNKKTLSPDKIMKPFKGLLRIELKTEWNGKGSSRFRNEPVYVSKSAECAT